MNNHYRSLVIGILILTFIYAFNKSMQIQTLKAKVPAGDPKKEEIYKVADHIGQNGSGIELKKNFNDLEITSVDPLGAGSGPVEYYYSPSADITFFYCKYFDSVISFDKGRIVYSKSIKTGYN